MTVVTQAFFKALKTTKSFSGASCFLSRCLIYKVHAASRRSSLSPSDLVILPQAVSLVKNFFQFFQTFFKFFRSFIHLRFLASLIRFGFGPLPSSACLYYQNLSILSTPFFDFFRFSYFREYKPLSSQKRRHNSQTEPWRSFSNQFISAFSYNIPFH